MLACLPVHRGVLRLLFKGSGDHRYLHVLTHSFPTRRSSDLPAAAHDYTARGNLVAVISNGTAVLGLGDIGPLAGKPVMEGKGVLFQKFAGIDVFDIEV